MGEFSLAGTDADEGGGPWAPIGPPVPMPPGWPSAGVPRISTFFPAGHPPVTEHRMTDVRVAANGGVWEGQQRATWWLETQDVTNPLNLSGVQAECPGELLVTWERDATGICHLTLVDTDDPSDPTVWRRWQNLGNWADWDRVTEYPWWSPGWLDADEGHIVMTRNTRALVPGSVPEDIRGEVWLVSLRWDKIVVFNADGLGTVVGSYNSTTGEIIRETGSWGSRRWIAQNTYQLLTGYDTKSIAKPVSPALPFVGTFANLESESLIPAVTYGVSIRRAEDDVVYLAYGVQRLPPTPYTSGEYGAGVIVLGEGPVFAKFDRTLFRKDTSSYDVWDETDEVWTAVGLSYYRALWWTQGGELGAFDEIEGVLCRTYFPPFAPNNDSVATYPEDSFWVDTNLFENRGLNLAVLDTTTIHEEIVFVASGWISGSHLTVLWHNPSTPALSVTKTFGPELSTEPVTHDLHVTIPSNEFPRWLPFLFQRSDVDLKRCRITGAGGRGADSFYAMEDGIWSAYCQFEGCTAEEFEYQILRGSSIDKGNFTVEMEGKYNPPFAGGYGIQAYDRMAFGQTAQFSLGVVGEKRLRASIGLKVRGNGLGTGGITIEAALEFMTGGGLVQHSASLPAVASQKNSGSFVKLRISRDAENWIFLYYNTELGDWVEVMNEFGHVLPVTPYLGASMADAVGLACAIGLEIDKITLAPFDDVTGQIFQRTVMYPTIPSVFGKIAGGVGVRELVPSSESGAIIIGDAWNFPGLMPRP
jgi:hypothetical protein